MAIVFFEVPVKRLSMTISNPILLTSIFMMEAQNGNERYSSGPLYSEREIKKATQLLSDKGYSIQSRDTLEGDIPVITFIDPEPTEDGSLRAAIIVLSKEESSMLAGTDTSWSGGMMVFGKTEAAMPFEEFTFEHTTMVWAFNKKEQPSMAANFLAPVYRFFGVNTPVA